MPNANGEFTDDEVFSTGPNIYQDNGFAPQPPAVVQSNIAPPVTAAPPAGELSDAEVFGAPAAPVDTGPGAWERALGNARDAFQYGTIMGAGTRYIAPKIVGLFDNQAADNMKAYDEMKKANFDKMQSFTEAPTLAQGAEQGGAALAGQIIGSLPSPENAIALPAKAIGALGKAGQYLLREGVVPNILRRGTEAAVVNTATDPAVQGINIASGAQKEYDPMQTALQAPLGFLIGGGTGAAMEWKNLGKGLRDFISKKDKIEPEKVTPEMATPENISAFEMSDDLRNALKANNITDPADPRLVQLETRLNDRRAQEANRAIPPAEASVAAVAGEKERLRAEQDAIALGDVSPGAASTTGKPVVPERALPVTPEGQAVSSTEVHFDAAKAPAGAEASAKLRDDQAYQALTERVGTDPAPIVEKQFSIPAETFKSLPPDARERVVTAAQKQAAAEAPTGKVYSTSDNALGEDLYSPASKPTVRVNEAPATDKIQPTSAELKVSEKPYSQVASGISDRPFINEDKGLTPEQKTQFENQQRAKAQTMRDETIADLQRRWAEKERERTSSGKGRFSDAEQKYKGGTAKENFTNQAGKQDTEKRFPVDEFGFVKSTKGGPVRYADQKQAAKWIINQGHKLSPDQIFEIENHPSGKGFTVRERGRTEAAKPTTENTPQSEQKPGEQRLLTAAKDGAGSPDGSAGGPEAERTASSSPAEKSATTNDAASNPAPASEAAAKEQTKVDQPSTEKAPTEKPINAEPNKIQEKQPDTLTAAQKKEAVSPEEAQKTADKPANAEAKPAEKADPSAGAKAEEAPKTTEKATVDKNTESDKAPSEPRKPEGTKETVPVDKTGEKPEPEPSKDGDLKNTLYSNPADPALIKKMVGEPVARIFKKEKDQFFKELNVLRSRSAKAPGPNKKTVRQSIADVARVVAFSNRAVMNMLGDRYSHIKEIKAMRDQLASAPGEDHAIAQTFNEAVERRPVSRLHQVLNVLGKESDNAAFVEKVSDILSGRTKSFAASAETAAATRLRKILNEEYEYLKKAGLELGYVKDNYFPRTLDKRAIIDDPEAFQKAAMAVYKKMGISPEDAKIAAEEWYHRSLGIGQNKYSIGDYGPSNQFTKGRVLPKEADSLMKEFYVTDPVENLASYFRQTTRRAEFSRRFGKSGEKADEMFNSMLRQGMKPQDVNMMRDAFDSTTGNLGTGRKVDALSGAVSWIQTMGTLSLLPRAVVSSLAESIGAGVRSGSAMDSISAFYNSWRHAFGSKNLEDHKAAAEALGVIGHAFQQSMLAQRFGGGMESKLQSRILTNFFQRTGLEGLTEAQRIASVKIGQGFVQRMLDDVAAGSRVNSAKGLLGELGIAEKDIPAMTKWLSDDKGNVPVAKMLEDGDMADKYRTAIGRFVDESIQNPKAVDRPMLANHPVGRMMYSVMSFNYAFTRNVLFRTAKQVSKALDPKSDLTLGDRARLAGILVPFTMLMAAQMGVSRLREAVYNPDADAERSELDRRVLDISRSGITGTLDPIINAVASVKYERDLSNIAVGANMAFFLERIAKIAGLLPTEYGGKNSPKTNNAEWSATRAAYQMIAAPLGHTALSLAPGGPLMKVAYGALMAGPYPIGISTPQTSRAVADAIVGKRSVSPVSQKKKLRKMNVN